MKKRTRGKRPHRPARSRRPPVARLEKLVEEATVDAYDDGEQRSGFFTMIEDHLALPFEAEVLGMPVTIERIDMTAAGEIVAICKRGGKRQAIPILELAMPVPAPRGSEWIEAYRYWASRS